MRVAVQAKMRSANPNGVGSTACSRMPSTREANVREAAWVKENAFDFHWALQYCHRADVAAMRSVARAAGKVVIFGDLIGKPVHHRGRKAAVLRLIHDGELQPVFFHEKITMRSPLLVKVSEAAPGRWLTASGRYSIHNERKADV